MAIPLLMQPRVPFAFFAARLLTLEESLLWDDSF